MQTNISIQDRIDERDRAIITERMRAYMEREGPQVGDFVDFTDGTSRRISYCWDDDAQTSDGGSWHLGNYGVSFSGSLHPSVPFSSLNLTDEMREGWAWVFHHDFAGAGRGVDFTAQFRVWRCDLNPPR